MVIVFNGDQPLGLSGRVVMQRPAKPLTSVRFRAQPPFSLQYPFCARMAAIDKMRRRIASRQLVESRRLRFLQERFRCPDGGIGRRKGLKIPRWQHRAGSNPAPGTTALFFAVQLCCFCLVKNGKFNNHRLHPAVNCIVDEKSKD